MKIFKRILLVTMALCLGGFIGNVFSSHFVSPASADDVSDDAEITIRIKSHESTMTWFAADFI